MQVHAISLRLCYTSQFTLQTSITCSLPQHSPFPFRAADDVVHPRLPLSACLEAFAAPETIQDFYSSAIKGKTTTVKTARMGTFPPYLVLHMRKFIMDRGWVPRKLDVFVHVPEHLDLAALKATGRTDDEEELLEDDGLGAQCPENVRNVS
jgi:ubiquitin carboxyl-terminal hydrolase 5/13